MRCTITLDVMWQVDLGTSNAVEPTRDYQYESFNCYATHGYTTLVAVDDDIFVGHVDSDKSKGTAVELGVYKGDAQEIAARLRSDFMRLLATRQDTPGEPQPAEIVVWHREFSDEGGPELTATLLLHWKHPAVP